MGRKVGSRWRREYRRFIPKDTRGKLIFPLRNTHEGKNKNI